MTRLKNPWLSAVLDVMAVSIGWLVYWPLSLVIPRSKKIVVFFGRDEGKFLDNCKHLFVQLTLNNPDDFKYIYLARSKQLRSEIKAAGGECEVLWSIQSIWKWLRAGFIVVDSVDWMRGGRGVGARGAEVIQIWHGIPLKHIQLTRFRSRLNRAGKIVRFFLQFYVKFIGRYEKTPWFVSTSEFICKNAFEDAFKFEKISFAGYPRNDAFWASETPLMLLGVDLLAKNIISEWRGMGIKRIGVYAPTFRESLVDPFLDQFMDLNILSQELNENKLALLIKLHPWMHGRYNKQHFSNIYFVEAESDIYPILPKVDFLISDYSSIFFDFLLLDKPILYFAYDLEHYLRSERSMYFEYSEMTPGPKIISSSELLDAIINIDVIAEEWKVQRARLKSLVFKYPAEGSSLRLKREIFNNNHIES